MSPNCSRLKDLNDEIQLKYTDIEHLKEESNILSSWAPKSTIKAEVADVETELKNLEDLVQERKNLLEAEIEDCSSYHQSLQDLEKWVLQMSFQLMAHNSLYITDKAQTEEQIAQHSELLQDIQRYFFRFLASLFIY